MLEQRGFESQQELGFFFIVQESSRIDSYREEATVYIFGMAALDNKKNGSTKLHVLDIIVSCPI